MKIKLTKCTVQVRHYGTKGKSQKFRDGYKDENGQVFLPPSAMKLSAWLQKYDVS